MNNQYKLLCILLFTFSLQYGSAAAPSTQPLSYEYSVQKMDKQQLPMSRFLSPNFFQEYYSPTATLSTRPMSYIYECCCYNCQLITLQSQSSSLAIPTKTKQASKETRLFMIAAQIATKQNNQNRYNELIEEIKKCPQDITATNEKGQTVLHMSAPSFDIEAWKLFYQHGANLYAQTNQNDRCPGSTPFHTICYLASKQKCKTKMKSCIKWYLENAGLNILDSLSIDKYGHKKTAYNLFTTFNSREDVAWLNSVIHKQQKQYLKIG